MFDLMMQIEEMHFNLVPEAPTTLDAKMHANLSFKDEQHGEGRGEFSM